MRIADGDESGLPRRSAARTLLTSFLAAGAAMLLHAAAALASLRLLEQRVETPVLDDGKLSAEVGESVLNLALVLLPGQVVLATLAVTFALRSLRGPRGALGLARPLAGTSDLLLVAWAAPSAMLVGSLLVNLVHGDRSSATMEQILQLVAAPRSGIDLLLLAAMLSLAPAMAEELFFRGWMQRRLQLAVGPLAAIGVTSVAFAAMHLDPVQSTGVLPAGLFLGYVAWRMRSLWPAVIGHAAFNGFAVLAARFAAEAARYSEDAAEGRISLGLAAFVGAVIASPLAALVIVFRIERRARRSPPEST